ncbi:MAG: hypothetical protein HYZ75_11330 [Elusimicrobia bacterium]|nr:hypothetical protein [Elusimicrobiota bacterium]
MSRRRRRAGILLAALMGGLVLGGRWVLSLTPSAADKKASASWAKAAAALAAGENTLAAEELDECLRRRPERQDCSVARSLLRREENLLIELAASRRVHAATLATITAPADRSAPGVPLDDDQAKRVAIMHWNKGIIAFQKGDPVKARDEWSLCRVSDPKNEDCLTGLSRIDNSYGERP